MPHSPGTGILITDGSYLAFSDLVLLISYCFSSRVTSRLKLNSMNRSLISVRCWLNIEKHANLFLHRCIIKKVKCLKLICLVLYDSFHSFTEAVFILCYALCLKNVMKKKTVLRSVFSIFVSRIISFHFKSSPHFVANNQSGLVNYLVWADFTLHAPVIFKFFSRTADWWNWKHCELLWSQKQIQQRLHTCKYRS